MADLNKFLTDIRNKGGTLERSMQELLVAYDELYRAAHNELMSERIAANGSMDGLEEFHRLVNVLKRNRDVVGSIHRGFKSIRPLEGFEFVEEEEAAEEQKVQQKKQAQAAKRRKRRAEQQLQMEQIPSLDELIQGPPETPVVEEDDYPPDSSAGGNKE